jgi:hypothetical protein
MAFGLVGDFPRDDERIAAVNELRALVLSGTAVSVETVTEMLGRLPFGGRVEFANMLLQSPHRDALVRMLFEWCFTMTEDADVEDSEDAEFVLVGCGSTKALNTTKYFVLRVLVIIIPQCGRLGVDLFFEYDRTASTAFRNTLLQSLAASEFFSDDQLLASYQSTVGELEMLLFADLWCWLISCCRSQVPGVLPSWTPARSTLRALASSRNWWT